jgi:hypothetical protein
MLWSSYSLRLLKRIIAPVTGIALFQFAIHASAQSPSPPPLTSNIVSGEAPLLSDPKLAAKESVPKFIDWASRSGLDQRETARKIIAAARGDSKVAEELCDEINQTQQLDHDRTLVMLSVIGEMRNPDGEKCLTTFLHQPLPLEGTVVNGEILEQTALGMLQAKAVDGLAYASTATGTRETLWAAGSHPSRIVRAEAINAYLWNQKDSSAARAQLLKVVRPDERDFLDRPRLEPGASSSQFNKSLALYARKHLAPKPERLGDGKLSPEQGTGDGPAPTIEPKPISAPPQEK